MRVLTHEGERASKPPEKDGGKFHARERKSILQGTQRHMHTHVHTNKTHGETHARTRHLAAASSL